MTNQVNSIPESFVSIMGYPPTILGETNDTYMLLLEKLGAATAARSIIDWMMVKDVADLTWQILRVRRWMSALLDNGRREGLMAGIDQLINPRPGSLLDNRAVKYAMDYYLDTKEISTICPRPTRFPETSQSSKRPRSFSGAWRIAVTEPCARSRGVSLRGGRRCARHQTRSFRSPLLAPARPMFRPMHRLAPSGECRLSGACQSGDGKLKGS
jgi:hypothetical protein